MNARSVATLGLGFGVIAVASIGFLTPDTAQAELSQRHGGGGARVAAEDRRTLTIADVNARYELDALRKRNQEIDRAAAEAAETAKAEVLAAAKAAGDAVLQAKVDGNAQRADAVVPAVEIDPAVLMAMFDEFF